MSELNKKDRQDYSKYDEMSTEALEEILRLDFQMSEDAESDIDAILYISEVIAKRNEQSGAPAVNVEAAWEQFRTKYLPYADGRSLYDFNDEEPGCAKAASSASDNSAPSGKKHISARGRRRLGRIAILAASIVVLLSLMMATTYALGYDLWGTFAQWTKDTFAFVSGSATNSTEEPITEVEYASLQAALDAYGVAEPLAPTWIPDGFVLDSVSVDDTSSPRVILFQASYCCEDRWIAIQITMHRDANSVIYTEWQKDDAGITTMEIENCTFYMMRNAERECAAWSKKPFECSIIGDITFDELSEMLKSIYTRND